MKSIRAHSITFVIMIFIGISIQAQPQPIDMKLRKAFIDSTVRELKAFRPDGNEPIAEYIPLGEGKHRFFITERGLLNFESGEWLYLVSHSGHKDSRIGDLLVAVDNRGKTYYVPDHVCGGILITFSKTNPNFMLSDILNAKVNDHQGIKRLRSNKVLYQVINDSH